MENTTESMAKTQAEKPRKRRKSVVKRRRKIVLSIIIFLCALLSIYLGMTLYFTNHFFFGSEINGIKVSGKSVQKVNEEMAAKLQNYALNLKERNGKREEIKANEIGLKYESGGDFKSFKDNQKSYKWISAFFNTKVTKMTDGITYNEDILKKRVNNLSCFDSNTVVAPKDASVKYVDNAYVIVDEVNGNKVDKDILYEKIADAVNMEKTTLDLEAIDCYIKPQYTSKSQKLIDAKNTLNKYVASKITYTFGDQKESLDGSTINKWLKVDKNFAVSIDTAKVYSYIDSLCSTYNTVGKTRSFTNSSGQTINVSGGDYGWSINVDKEVQQLSTAIKEGQITTKEPTYSQTAASRTASDIGTTYVEVDMTKQHLWFYKNGTLVIEGDVVTGNMSSNHSTPAGVYKLKYKERNATLKGQDYEAPVNYWMPFNGGIGIHDASWRNTFGKDIYKTNGSHGCVNAPFDLAKTIFENIDAGAPIVCFY